MTLKFENDAPVVNGVTAHVYAKSTGTNSSATGFELVDGVNLNITSESNKMPVMVAHSADGDAAVIRTSIGGHDKINIKVPSQSLSEGKTSAVVIGQSGIADDFKNSSLTLGAGNKLTSNGEAASVVIGAAGADNLNVTGGSTIKIGKGNIFDSYSNKAASVVGAAASTGTSTATGVSIDMNGSQTFGAIANEKVNAFGADSTNNWKVGIHSGDTAAVVDILAAKGTMSDSSVTLNNAQNAQADARAFALGENYQIYVGGKIDDNRALVSDGSAGTVNIFGGISTHDSACPGLLPNVKFDNIRLQIE